MQDEGIPAYVISAGGDRWRGAEEALGALGVRAERVAPVEASLQLAKAEYRVHSYANAVHFGEARTQREFSLLATFKHVLRLASKLPIGDDAFALVFEDDIAAHPAVTPASFMQALEYGAQLAAHDGLLYLGACGPDWATGTRVSHGGFDYAKAASFCTHALAVTRHAASSCAAAPQASGIHIAIVLAHMNKRTASPKLCLSSARLAVAHFCWLHMRSPHACGARLTKE